MNIISLGCAMYFKLLCATSSIFLFFGFFYLEAVVHLAGTNASVEVIGSKASWVNSAAKKAPQKQSVDNEAVANQKIQESTARIEKLEKLVQMLSQANMEMEAMREQEKKAAQHSAAVRQHLTLEGKVTLFGRDLSVESIGEKSVFLRMTGNSRVFFNCDDLIFRPQDKIIISGKNNELIISADTFFKGQLIFEHNEAQLTVKVAEGVTFFLDAAGKSIALTPGAEFTFMGPGFLNVETGNRFTFSTIPSAARLVLTNGLRTTLSGDGSLVVDGIGSFVLDHDALFDCMRNQKLVLGSHESDDINFIVCGNSVLNLESGLDVALVFDKGNYEISLFDDGVINVGDNAKIILNGMCRRFLINNGGFISFSQLGVFSFRDQSLSSEIELDQKSIRGEGLIECFGSIFYARMQPIGFVRVQSLALLIRSIINKHVPFRWATVFEDQEGIQRIFLPTGNNPENFKNGKFFELKPDVIVASEDVASKRVFGLVGGIFVEISDSIKPLSVPRTRMFNVVGESFYPGLREFFA